jgi:hypothetical protein
MCDARGGSKKSSRGKNSRQCDNGNPTRKHEFEKKGTPLASFFSFFATF